MAGLSKVLSPKNALLHPLNPVKSTMNDWKALTTVPMPKVPDPIAMPTVNQALIDQQSQDYARRRRGRAATVIAGDTGAAPAASLARASLLGG